MILIANRNFLVLSIIIYFCLYSAIVGLNKKENLDNVESSKVGKIWPSEKVTWIDPEYGHEITKWTSDKYKNWHLYFNIESFIDENNILIFSDRDGANNLFKLNLIDGTFSQLTNSKTKVKGNVWHYPQYNKIWYEVDKSIRVLDYSTMNDTIVFSFENQNLESFTVTCDSKYLIYSINKNPGYSENHSTGPYAIIRYDLISGEKKQISPDYGLKISHLQANPVEPSIVSYAWQHQYRKNGSGIVGNVPIRIWWLNIDGSNGGAIGPQEFGIHRTHEFWLYDGSRIGYSARYKFGENKGRQFLGSCKLDGSDSFMLEAPVGPAHSQIYKDNQHWVADQNDGMILTMWKFDRNKILHEEKLFRHNSSWIGQPSHPHPHFSPEGKKVLFSTDKTGKPCVYTVNIDLN